MSKTTYDWEFLTRLGLDTLAAQGTLSSDEANDEPVEDPVRLIAGRYALDDILGRGGGGQVYRATDRLTGENVAVKLLGRLHGESLAKVRREITALRWLRLPGVVQLRDSGLAGGEYFLVMDLVEGRPFPGPRAPVPWEALAPTATELLEVLARVHLAGVVHRDLKPANVLVTRDGRPVVLDFGLAQGRAVTLGAVRGRAEGTPAYVAPEQIRGQACDARTDLYAVGAMLFEALTGLAPHGSAPMNQVLQRRLHEPPPRIGDAVEDLPPNVERLIDRLLARAPEDRPASAAEALEALGGHPITLYLGAAADLPLDHRLSEAELRPLFAGPDPFLHLVEDGARTLWARTGGDPLVVREELGGWVRAGLAHWDEDRLVISRAALERLERGLALTAATEAAQGVSDGARALLRWIRLAWPDATVDLLARLTGASAAEIDAALAELRASGQVWDLPDGRVGAHPGWTGAHDLKAGASVLAEAAPPQSEARLRGMLAAELNAETIVSELRQIAAAHIDEGRSPRALALLELGLDLLSDVPDALERAAREDELLRLYAIATLRQESEPAMERALYELGRASGQTAHQQALATLVLGSLAARRREAERALELLDGLRPFPDPALEALRASQQVRAAAARSPVEEERRIAALEQAPERDAQWTAMVAALRGNLLYRQGQMRLAAESHSRSLALRERPDARLACAVNLATVQLDALQLDHALHHASLARQVAADLRHPRYEAIATHVERSARYRLAEPLGADPALVEAAAQLSPYLERLFAVLESAIAWRAGDLALGARVAALGADAAGQQRLSAARALCLGLHALCSGGASAASQGELIWLARGLRVPELSLQVWALLALSAGGPEPAWREEARALSPALRIQDWSSRLEVLSLEESWRALDLPFPRAIPAIV